MNNLRNKKSLNRIINKSYNAFPIDQPNNLENENKKTYSSEKFTNKTFTNK